MNSDYTAIQHLNILLNNELMASNHYLIQAKIYAKWGLDKLAARLQEDAIEEYEHAGTIINKILDLQQQPSIHTYQLDLGNDVITMLKNNEKLEQQALADLKQAVAYFEKEQDYAFRLELCKIIEEDTLHLNWLHTQLHLIDKMGIKNYLQLQVTNN